MAGIKQALQGKGWLGKARLGTGRNETRQHLVHMSREPEEIMSRPGFNRNLFLILMGMIIVCWVWANGPGLSDNSAGRPHVVFQPGEV
jgi:hypothetical protein